MKKIGPLTVILSALFLITLATMGLLVAQGIMKNQEWLGKYTDAIGKIQDKNVTASVGYGIVIGLGFVELVLGMMALKKSRGLAAFILFGVITASVVMNIISGVKSNDFPTAAIISISVSGVAAFALGIGMLSKN